MKTISQQDRTALCVSFADTTLELLVSLHIECVYTSLDAYLCCCSNNEKMSCRERYVNTFLGIKFSPTKNMPTYIKNSAMQYLKIINTHLHFNSNHWALKIIAICTQVYLYMLIFFVKKLYKLSVKKLMPPVNILSIILTSLSLHYKVRTRCTD